MLPGARSEPRPTRMSRSQPGRLSARLRNEPTGEGEHCRARRRDDRRGGNVRRRRGLGSSHAPTGGANPARPCSGLRLYGRGGRSRGSRSNTHPRLAARPGAVRRYGRTGLTGPPPCGGGGCTGVRSSELVRTRPGRRAGPPGRLRFPHTQPVLHHRRPGPRPLLAGRQAQTASSSRQGDWSSRTDCTVLCTSLAPPSGLEPGGVAAPAVCER